MTTHLLPADQLAKVRECIYDHGNGKYKGDVSKAQREEALSILDNLTEVEVVAWMGPHGRVIEDAEKDPRFAYTHKYEIPLYGSKT